MSATDAGRAEKGTPAPFSDILCAVDGSRGATEAVRQAIALCGPDTALDFLAVTYAIGVGLTSVAELSEQRARAGLEEAARLAKQAGVHASTELRSGTPASDLLLAEAVKHDLLVLGCHGGSRVGGVMLGSTVTQVAHRTEQALLVARRSADGGDLPKRVLLATDGSSGSWAAARVATPIAQAQGAQLRVVYVPEGTHPERYREVLKQIAMIEKATGAAPAVIDTPGHAAERIIEAARTGQSSLIAIGQRGVKGIKALGSVSERVVHRAPCSVMVVPPGAEGG
jgi:nucleotide-binding universal stress UspA family protein